MFASAPSTSPPRASPSVVEAMPTVSPIEMDLVACRQGQRRPPVAGECEPPDAHAVMRTSGACRAVVARVTAGTWGEGRPKAAPLTVGLVRVDRHAAGEVRRRHAERPDGGVVVL